MPGPRRGPVDPAPDDFGAAAAPAEAGPVPRPPILSPAALARAGVVVIASGPFPGPDAVAVTREIAHRLPGDESGRVLLLVHTPEEPPPGVQPEIPEHYVGPLLLSWSDRGLSWEEGRAELAVLRRRLHTVTGTASLDGTGALVSAGVVSLMPKGRISVDLAEPGTIPATHVLGPQRIVIATGTTPALPDLRALSETTWWTPAGLLDRDDLPDSVAVLGAGQLGCETAQGLARLGVTVTLIEEAGQVLPGLPPATVGPVARALERDGVRVLTRARTVTVAPTLDGGAWVGTDTGGDVAAEALVLATGRRPRTAGLDLAAAGVDLGPDGAPRLDDRLRTTVQTVLACGNVTGIGGHGAAPGPMARLVAANTVARRPALRWTTPVAARIVRTDPELAVLGDLDPAPGAVLVEGAGPGTGTALRVVVGAAQRGLFGLTRSFAPEQRTVLGVALLGPGGADAIGSLVLAVNAGLPASALADVDAAEGTWAAAVQAAVSAALRAQPPDQSGGAP